MSCPQTINHGYRRYHNSIDLRADIRQQCEAQSIDVGEGQRRYFQPVGLFAKIRQYCEAQSIDAVAGVFNAQRPVRIFFVLCLCPERDAEPEVRGPGPLGNRFQRFCRFL